MSSIWGMTPRQSIEGARSRLGERYLALECKSVLEGKELTPDLGYILSGPASLSVFEGREGGIDGRWPKVWALRALLYAWDEEVAPAVVVQLDDESWRVQEMALKVVRRRQIDEALEKVAALRQSENARVRSAAQRALTALSAS